MISFNFCCLPIPVKLSRDLKKLPVFIQVSAWHFDHRKNIKLLIVISTMISNLRKICTCIPRNPAVSVRRNSVFYSKKKQVLHVLYSDLLDLDLNNLSLNLYVPLGSFTNLGLIDSNRLVPVTQNEGKVLCGN